MHQKFSIQIQIQEMKTVSLFDFDLIEFDSYIFENMGLQSANNVIRKR